MSEPREVRKARATVEERENSYVRRMVEQGQKLGQQGAVAESQEQRQGRQQAATAGVQRKQDDAASQGMGA